VRVQKQIPRIANSHNDVVKYHQGPILTNGALEFVYDKETAYPLLTLWGPGIPTEQQFSIPGPQLRVELALTNAPIYGAGVPAGSTEFQHLIDESEDGSQGAGNVVAQ
jgi:hypothetical protein